MKQNALFILMLVILAVTACVDDSIDSSATYIAGFQDSKVRDMTLDELSKRGTWFKVIGANRIQFKKNDHEKVKSIAQKVTDQIIPPTRSVQYNPTILREFLKRLDSEGITYSVVKYGDLDTSVPKELGITLDWVVWPEEYALKVSRIQENLDQDLVHGLVPFE